MMARNNFPQSLKRFLVTRRTISLCFVAVPVAAMLVFVGYFPDSTSAQEAVIELNNGARLEGLVVHQDSYNNELKMGAGNNTILIVDDGLRRVFTRKANVRSVTDGALIEEAFEVEQFGVRRNAKNVGVGTIMRVWPFNEYGRRMIRIMGTTEPITLIQGIVEITPRFCVLRTVDTENALYNGLEMRIATSSIPTGMLSRIMRHHINADNITDRLKIVSFYQQSERYHDAELELLALIRDFPEMEDEKQRELKLLRQAWANQIVRELKNRIDRGQYSLADIGIRKFPKTQVASEILLEVKELKESIERRESRREQILVRVESVVKRFLDDKSLAKERVALVETFAKEIESEITLNNISRFAAFMTLSDDASLAADQALALGVSGWLLGSDGSTENVEIAFSLMRLRDLVVEYLRSTSEDERARIEEALAETEAASAANIARIIANIKPFLETESLPDMPRAYQLQAPGVGDIKTVDYQVQLPPDYDPYRRYPCIVALCGGNSVESEMQWWAGRYNKDFKMRRGEAAIRGYIVVAVNWKTHGRAAYEYSIQEHAAVLNSMRDAFKRFSIDTDRVFLAGHGPGGSAAWDIGLSHPDLWAGVIPIVAKADKFIKRYWDNARFNLPLYFVIGEHDYPLKGFNGTEWDRHLLGGNFDMTVVEYRGRGREPFYEEIKNIYDWMELSSHRREFAPEEFKASALRPWDNFFWFVEVDKMRDNAIMLPQEWPKKGLHPTKIEKAEIREKNNLWYTSSALAETIWLAPEYIDFEREISINGRKGMVEPDPLLLLEDVRTRCDRQHPFWAKIDPSLKPWK